MADEQHERLITALEENTRAMLLLVRTMPDFIQEMQSADAVTRAGLSKDQLFEEAAEIAKQIKKEEQ